MNKAKEIVFKANIVEDGPSRPPLHHKRNNHKPKGKFWNNNKKKFNTSHSLIQKKKGNCFVRGKAGHYAAMCRQRSTNNNNKGSTSTTKADVAEVQEMITVVVSEAHMAIEVGG